MTEQERNETMYEPEEKDTKGRRLVEEIEVAGRDVVSRVQDLIEEGNIRRLIFLTSEDKVLLEVPLTAGVAAGAATVFIAPMLAAVAAIGAFLAKVKIQIVREDNDA